MSPFNLFALSLLFLSIIQMLFFTSQAIVPSSSTFKYVNEGELGPYIVEYSANYRILPIGTSPFQLFFYNTTPDAFTLSLRMATSRSESIRRWVWEANRGNPVRENATISFGTDGNLVLAEADGKIVWQTNTANKGAVGFKVLPNGNMVIYNSKGIYLWESFNSATDTLLVGQSLRVGGDDKLVSRASEQSTTDGPYSLVLEPNKNRLGLYYKSPNSPKPMLYFSSSYWFNVSKGESLQNVTLSCSVDEDMGKATDITIDYGSKYTSGRILTRPKYNSTLSFLRLGIDGNLKIYTYNDLVDWGAWEITYSLFDRENYEENTECNLPGRCGKFGLCEDNQCVACPLPSGLMGWSKKCEPIKVTSCKPSDFHYYKVEGVEHFLSKYTMGDGRVKEEVCESKCTKDCKCMGYFYHKDTSRCWIAHDLMTLAKVENSAHVGYIKTPNTH